MKSTVLTVSFSALVCASAAQADMINIVPAPGTSTANLGVFSGTAIWNPKGANQGQLTITLTNAAGTAAGGKLTGFVFNVNTTAALTATLDTRPNANWQFMNNPSASPFDGPFRFGAAIGGSFEGGGNPNNGLSIGQTGTFMFTISGSGVGNLRVIDFVNFSQGVNFAVRFRGFDNGGSDKIGAIVPAPGAVALMGMGALLATRRRRAN